ncbi:MAG: zinc-dependent metalloprotease [Fimbriimonadaceae bacterium]|nr:zinc-dependent metalloprotease [Fimbriimonadaceae bacterium]QYK55787.1 MAG: zinc-dependent metalloprotease [Fimbriimonadaceae bacterium]
MTSKRTSLGQGRLYGLFFALSLVAAAPAVQEKVKLQVLGTEGQIARYKSTANVQLDAGGQQLKLEINETYKVTVMKSADGTVTFERLTESSSQSINGQTMPASEEKEAPSTTVVRADGTLASYKDSRSEDDEGFSVRLWIAQQPVFSEKPVGVGDKWKYDYKADATLRSKAASANFELVAFEEVAGVKCAKINMRYTESSGTPALGSKSVLWVEVATGDVVKNTFELSNVPFPGPTGTIYAQATGTGERTAGSPMPGGPGGEAGAEPEAKKIEDVVKGYDKLEGFVTAYTKDEEGRKSIYLEVKNDQVGKLMMLQATAGSGNSEQVVTGNPINDLVFKLEPTSKDRVAMVVPNLNFRSDASLPIDRAVKRSFAESFVEQFRVEARSKERDSFLIDVSDLFRGDIARLNALFQGGGGLIPGLGGGSSYSMDREKSYVSSFKLFPENLVAETVYNFQGSGGGGGGLADLFGGGTNADPRSIVVKVVYNLFPLPTDNGYKPRKYDARVGYFTVAYQDFTKDADRDQTTQWIIRWNLQKKDPSQALSEPVKPIVFWLDNAIPTDYRDAVRDALLVWNPAFEKIGFKDAIQVKQMPDDADFDPADMRYNVVRWVASPNAAYAVALFRPNPVTGEILNASILVDANIVRATTGEFQVAIDPASAVTVESEPKPESLAALPFNCRAATDGLHQAHVGNLAVQLLAAEHPWMSEKEYLKQFITHVVAHEFGHILGLRHNFVASTELDAHQLGNPDLVSKDSTSASVMDYVPFNPFALSAPGTAFYGPGIGKYDAWAVAYGYSDFGGSRIGEQRRLAEIATQTNSPGLAYQSDEVADGFDPYITRFDLSAQPIEYWTKMGDLSKSLLSNLSSRLPRNGESYYKFTRDFNSLLSFQTRSASQLVRYVGALRRNANFRGDAGEKPTLAPIPLEEQRQALQALAQTALAENSFELRKSDLVYFTMNPDAGLMEGMIAGSNSFPILDQLSAAQKGILNNLMSPARLSRVANNQFKAPEGQLSLAEIFQTVDSAVWSEVAGRRQVTQIRRDLQRNHVDLLMTFMLRPQSGLPNDARTLAWDNLRTLAGKLEAAAPKTADTMTRLHWEETAMRIRRALDARETIGGQGQAPMSLLEMLLGGGRTKD